MIRFEFEQSDLEIYSSHGGLSVVGQILNRYSELDRILTRIPLRHGISHLDLFRTYLGVLCTGKNDFEAVDGFASDEFFQHAMGVGQMPSAARLRQRFDEHAEDYTRAADAAIVPLLRNLKAPITALPSGHVALHADVFCLDNSKTRKQGVARTYHGYDGYAPIGAYLGEEGWCIGAELRPGSQHSQKEFGFFLDRILPRARALADQRPLLLTLDAGHDAQENRQRLADESVEYLIKWNPRGEDPQAYHDRAEQQSLFVEVRAGKRVALFEETHRWRARGQTYSARRVVQLTERTIDAKGQPMLFADLRLDGWWTNLDRAAVDSEALIALYKRRGTSEQFHSELKTDLDLERLPSGKFATNELVLALGALAYNLLRYVGQSTLIGPHAPPRKNAKRRRIRTVLEEMIYKAVRLIRHGRQLRLRFSRGDVGYAALARCYRSLAVP